MSSSEADDRRARIREDAHVWVAKILDDPETHKPGLREWVGNDQEREDEYNAIFRETREGGLRGGELYGSVRVRQANRSIPKAAAIPFGRIIGLAVALLVMGFGLNMLLSALTGRLSPASVSPASTALYATQIGEIRTFRLSDGSQVTLDTLSSVRVAFSDKLRRVDLLSGRARFDVVHNDHVPFRLYARGLTVTDRGTLFDVDMNDGLTVHLLKGAADVTPPPGGLGPVTQMVHLCPGQTIRFVQTAASQPTETKFQPRWPEGKLTFDDVPASTVAAEANRYATTRIEFADPTSASERVFLDIDVRDSHAVAAQIAAPLKLWLDESRPGRIILRKNF